MNDNTVCCQNRELTEPAGETAVPYGVRWRKTIVRAKRRAPHPPCKARSPFPSGEGLKLVCVWMRDVEGAVPYGVVCVGLCW